MKTKTVLLRGVEIGAGRPKIIVPIVGKTEQEILDKAAQLVQAKPEAYKSGVRMDELYEKAMAAFKRYSGQDEEDGDEY